MSVAIMYSGGLDSFIMYHYAVKMGKNPIAIHIDLGHPYGASELQAINQLSIPTMELNIGGLWKELGPTLLNQIIPARNLLFATIGAMFCEEIWLGALDGEQNGQEHDKSERFFNDATNLLSFLNEFFRSKTIVHAPFKNMSKAEVVKWAINNQMSKDELLKTTSCYSGLEKPCGTCLTCVKRNIAFKLNNIEEHYTNDPNQSEYFLQLKTLIPKAVHENDYRRFTPKRIKEFFIYCSNEGIKL